VTRKRDLRDPIKLGETYLSLREKKVEIQTAVQMPVQDYDDGGVMSSDWRDHHSQTPQTTNHQDAA